MEEENAPKRNTENKIEKDFSKNSVQKQKQQKQQKKLKKYFDITASKYLIPTPHNFSKNGIQSTENRKSFE